MTAEKSKAAFAHRAKTWLSKAGTALYRYHYGVGLHTVRLLRRLGRWLAKATAPMRRAFHYVWLKRAVRPVRRFNRRMRRLGAGFAGAFRQLGRTARQKPLAVIPCFFRLLHRGVRRYWEEISAVGRLIGPVAAAVVLGVTIQRWNNVSFCLNLNYRGEDLGLIADAAIYDVGAALATDRVNNIDNSFSVDTVPQLSMTMRDNRPVMSEKQICDAILRTAGDSIAEATGLYVDGEFLGAKESQYELNQLLDSIKDGHYDKNDKSQRAEFVQKVETVDGLYPIAAVDRGHALKDILTAQTVVEKIYVVEPGDSIGRIAAKHDMTAKELREMNPAYLHTDMVHIGDKMVVQRPQTFLRVKVIKTLEYTETIDYKTQTIYDDDKPVTWSKVKTRGQEGSQDIVAEATFIDGVETGRTILSKTVTKQPVTKVIVVGTKRVQAPDGSYVEPGDGVVTGNMVWPVPVCHRVYDGFYPRATRNHRRHLGIDISSGPVPVRNKPAIAADGGTVVYAGWNGGYGKFVKIRHANGLETAYGHLNKIKVAKGQQVTRGQTIGLIGNTGRSNGNHLHFEVIKNGIRVNPLNYVRP